MNSLHEHCKSTVVQIVAQHSAMFHKAAMSCRARAVRYVTRAVRCVARAVRCTKRLCRDSKQSTLS